MNEEAAAAWMQAQEAIEDIDRMLAERNRAAVERAYSFPASAEGPEPKPRTVEPRERAQPPQPRPAPAPPVANKVTRMKYDDAGRVTETSEFLDDRAAATGSWEAWIRNYVTDYVTKYVRGAVAGIRDAVAEFRKEDRERAAGILAEAEARMEARIAQLEARLEQAEARAAPKPRLVEESDAAD